ncbi:hypothetical protein NDU88_006678 [Pleurodeles waltl]|uniref:Uncharacterized protein n=1 Tax=Pleurodeles waltl TaxID=8319 RepID=A0AAV7L4U7_PLEWA|nr:hypothetical protein NDU88_006678 [Pleurodeles waltl]
MDPSRLSAVRRGLQRPRYGQTLVQNGAVRTVSCQARAPTETPVWAVSLQARALTETPVRTDTCTEWSCQPSGQGTHRDPGTGCEPSGRAPTETPERAVSRQTRSTTETLVRAVSRQARAPTETPVRTDTCTEWTPPGCQLSGEGYRDPGTDRHLYRMEPCGLSAIRRGHPQSPRYGQTLVQNGALWAVAVRRGHPQRPRYGQTLVENGALRAVGRQPRAPTETPVRTDTCTEWSPPGCQPSGEGTHRDPGTGCQPSDEGTHRDPGTDRHLYTCTEWSPLGCQPSGKGTHRDPGMDRHLYRMEPSGLSGEGHRDPGTDRHLYRMELSAVRRGHPQRPVMDRHLYRMEPSGLSAVRGGHPQRLRYGQTLVHYGALQAVSRQARAPTETAVRTDTCTEWSPPGCELSVEGTHRDPSMEIHLYRMEPSGLSAVRQGDPQRPWYGLSAVRRGHPQRPRYGLSAVRRGPQRPRYGQTLVQNGALWAVSLQARAQTKTLVWTDTCIEWSPLGFQLSGEGTHRDPGTGCQPSGEGTHRDPGTDRRLYRMEPSGLSAVGQGHPQRPRYGLSAVRRGPQRPRYGQTLVQNGALWAVSLQARAPTETPVRVVSRQTRAPTETLVRAVSRQARAPTETPVRTDTCTEWTPPGCQLSGEGYRDPGTTDTCTEWSPADCQARAPTETPVRTDTCTEWSCQPSGEGTHRDPGTGCEPSGRAPTETPESAVSRQTRATTETLVRAVSRQARAPTETPVPDRHLYRVDPSRMSAVRRGLQRPWYRQTLVQNGALRTVSRQARAHTETLVRTDTCIEWSPLGCQLSGEGTHRDPGTGCQPSGDGTHRDPGTDRRLYRMEPSGLSAVGQGHPQRPRYGLSAVRRGPQRPRYGQTLVQNGALWAVSLQARAPTETPPEWSPPGCQPSGEGTPRDPGTDRHLYRMQLSAVRRGHPQRPRYGLSAFRRGHSRRPQYRQTLVQNGAVSLQARAPTETPVRADASTEWSRPGCHLSGDGHRDPGTDRHLYTIPVRPGHPQRPRYGL